MESYLEYLAFLSWQGQTLNLQDFKKIHKEECTIRSLDDMVHVVSHPATKKYLREHKKEWYKQAEQDKKACEKEGVHITWPFHVDYPPTLLNMHHPPWLISWRGKSCWKNRFLLSIVGSRHPYTDTLLWMDTHLSAFLKTKKDICIASGGARGVDQKAHALCLANKLPTLCFLPCGIKNFYPANLCRWSESILEEGGAFLSVFPLDAPMHKSHFHVRNEVLAFFSDLVFIAQADMRSGTMVTGRYALNAGVNIATIPGSPLYSGYKGNLSLINDGCFMIRDYLDLETLYQSSMHHDHLKHTCTTTTKQKTLSF